MRANSDTQSRREFFRSAGRHGLLAVLTATAAVLGRRALAQRCINQGICSGCRVFAECGLPQALSARQARQASGKERL
jgi:hypothetical protein